MAKGNPNKNRGGKPAVENELLDFSNDPWSWKGKAPSYPITPDGLTFDIDNENGLDRKAVSLGILGMVIIVFNAKSATIREEEVLPVFFEVIGTRNWLTLTKKEAGISAKTVIGKLTDAELSGDVFDLCSFAPLEIKRALIRMLFKVARLRFKPEFREEAETRIVEDIVPSIFADPAYELALLTGNIIREDSSSESELPSQSVAATEPFNSYESPAVPEAAPEVAAVIPENTESKEATPEPQQAVVPDRDAEEALRERMEQLTKAVPNLPPRPVEKHEDDYVPFSDMENDLEFKSAKAPAPVQPSHGEAPVQHAAPAPVEPVSARTEAKPERRSGYPEHDIAAELYSQSSYSAGINAPAPSATGMMEAGSEYGFVPTPPAFNYETGEIPRPSLVQPNQPNTSSQYPQSQPQAAGRTVSGYPQNYPQSYPQGYPQQGGANFANVPNFGPAPTFAQPSAPQYPAGYPQPAQMPSFANTPNFGQPPAFAQVPPVQHANPTQSGYPQPYPPTYPQGYPQPPYPQAPNYPQGWQQGQPPMGYPQAPYPGVVPPAAANPNVPSASDDLNTTAPRKAV